MVCLSCVVVPVVGATVVIGVAVVVGGRYGRRSRGSPSVATGRAARSNEFGVRRPSTSRRCDVGGRRSVVVRNSARSLLRHAEPGSVPARHASPHVVADPRRHRTRLPVRCRHTSVAVRRWRRTDENEIFGPNPRCARRAPRWLAARETRSVRDRRGLELWSTRRERGWTERAGRSRQSTGTRARSRSRQSPR